MSRIAVLSSLSRNTVLVVLAVFVGLSLSTLGLLFALELGAVQRNQVGQGWRYASRDEVSAILQQCRIEQRQVVSAAKVFPLGWAWNQFPETDLSAKSACFRRELTKLGATAVIYDGMG